MQDKPVPGGLGQKAEAAESEAVQQGLGGRIVIEDDGHSQTHAHLLGALQEGMDHQGAQAPATAAAIHVELSSQVSW